MGYRQINLPTSMGLNPCRRCGTQAVVFLSEKLGWACQYCLEMCFAAIEDEGAVQEEQEEDRYMLMLQEEAIDLYCLMAGADTQMDYPQ
jgi:hypothetical protein